MTIAQFELQVETSGRGLLEITQEIATWVSKQAISTGLLTIFCRHTSASLIIQENADPDVRHDLEQFFNRLVKEEPSLYRHASEGSDDMPAHIRGSLTSNSLSIPVQRKRALLGRWQGIYIFEHRRRPHRRQLVLHLDGQ